MVGSHFFLRLGTQDDLHDWLAETSASFNAMFREMSEVNETLETIAPSNFAVSTMTIQGKLSEPVGVDDVIRAIENGDASFEQPTKRSKTGNSFYNQVSVKVGNASIKLFSNGTVHFTGAKSPIHFLDVMDRVCASLGAIAGGRAPTLESTSILLINASFYLSKNVSLAAAREALEDAGHVTSYDPDAYPGVVTKIATSEGRLVTAMLFASGTVIVAGAKRPADIAKAYETVCRVVDAMDQTNSTPSPRAKSNASSIQTYDIVDGYPAKVAYLCSSLL